ncbi:hypothetical protein [Listeria welshimeri]|uniref:hypothetical protein n=1 Tax=Listeria welshimeri TaxID=1643 RepID=UPI001E3F9FFA|nr:hypothetical protein [Listeria welshimeri]
MDNYGEDISREWFCSYKKDNTYTIEWPQGPFDQTVSHPIIKKLADKAFRSSEDAYEVMIYVDTGLWPEKNTEDEENERVRGFVRKFPESLIKVPDNQALFIEEELKELIPLGKKNLSKEE